MAELEFLGYLEPVYDRHKSFCKKAKLYRDLEGHVYLESYKTIVAKITDGVVSPSGKNEVEVYGWYSQTTARHINDFLVQWNFVPMTKKEMGG